MLMGMDWRSLPSDNDLLAALECAGPMNLSRAVAVMERHGLDGLVLGDPVNVFHALGHWPQIARTRAGQPPGTFALIARARPEAPGLVTSRFLHHYSWADGRNRDDVAVWLYDALGDAGDEALSAVPDGPVLPQRSEQHLTAPEAHRARISAALAGLERMAQDAGAAIVGAMRAMGLWRGRIGFDHPVIAQVAAHHDHPGAMVRADNPLREIRMVKSPLEHALMARVVSLKFEHARGLALGLMLMGTGAAAMLAPALLGPVFAQNGWRNAVLVMAVVTLAVGLPASLLIGTSDKPVTGATAKGKFEANRKTLVLLVIAFLLGLIVAGLIVHLVPMLVDRGMAAADAARVAAGVGAAVLVARLVVGYLFDRFHAPYVAALFLLSPVVAALLLWSGGPVVPAALMLGMAAGAEVDMLAYFTGCYARIANYGATYGGVLGVFCLGAGLGPMLFGKAYDAWGGYDTALISSAAVLLIVVSLIATLGAYRTQKPV